MPSGTGVRVLFLQYANPGGYPPVLHAMELLARAGCDVRALGVAPPTTTRTVPVLAGVTTHLLRLPRGGWRLRLHAVWFVLRALATGLRTRPTWVYVSDPQACPAAWCLQRVLGVPLVYHEHDSPAPDVERRHAAARVVAWARRAVGRSAALCVLPSEPRADAFGQLVGRADVQTVWNTPLLRELGDPPARRDGLRVVYHGSIVPARVPLSIIDALSALPEAVTLTIVGYRPAGHAGHAAALAQHATQLGVGTRVEIREAVDREALMRGISAFDVGLALLPMDTDDLNEASMVGASNKVFDYFAAGVPAVVSARPEWEATFVRAGVAVSCRPESAASLAAALQRLLEDPDARVAMGRRGQDLVRHRWHYEASFAPVMARLGLVLPVAA